MLSVYVMTGAASLAVVAAVTRVVRRRAAGRAGEGDAQMVVTWLEAVAAVALIVGLLLIHRRG